MREKSLITRFKIDVSDVRTLNFEAEASWNAGVALLWAPVSPLTRKLFEYARGREKGSVIRVAGRSTSGRSAHFYWRQSNHTRGNEICHCQEAAVLIAVLGTKTDRDCDRRSLRLISNMFNKLACFDKKKHLWTQSHCKMWVDSFSHAWHTCMTIFGRFGPQLLPVYSTGWFIITVTN